MASNPKRAPWERRADTLLRNTFGLSLLREGQGAVIDHVMNRKNVLAIMPTGAGKSLCYQAACRCCSNGRTLVVSPLIALMKDQCDKLVRARRIRAVQLNSSLAAKADAHEAQAAARRPWQTQESSSLTPERIWHDAGVASTSRQGAIR